MIAHPLVPDAQVTAHIVQDDFDKLGRAYREAYEARVAPARANHGPHCTRCRLSHDLLFVSCGNLLAPTA